MTHIADVLGVEVDAHEQQSGERGLKGPVSAQDWLMKTKA
jgi:hypothetical protein